MTATIALEATGMVSPVAFHWIVTDPAKCTNRLKLPSVIGIALFSRRIESREIGRHKFLP